MSSEDETDENARDKKGRFAKGNPGKPKGARSRTTLAVERLLAGDANKLTRKAIEAALAGDITALRLCLERIAPVRKGRIVTLDKFPTVKCAADVPAALASLLDSVAKGDLTTDEADAIAALCSRYVTALDAVDLETRLKALEDRLT